MNKQAQMSLPSFPLPHNHNFSSCLYLLKGTTFFLSLFVTTRTRLFFHSHSVFARTGHKSPPPSTEYPSMMGLSPVGIPSILRSTEATSTPVQGMLGRHGPLCPAVCIQPCDYVTAR